MSGRQIGNYLITDYIGGGANPVIAYYDATLGALKLATCTGGCTTASPSWVITIVDVFKRHYSGWTTVGWIALIIVLPFIGSLIYWAVRKPTQHEVEEQAFAEAALRQQRQR